MTSPHTTSPHASDLASAFELATIADAITLAGYNLGTFETQKKPDGSWVTDTDLATEKAIRDALSSMRPEDGFFGEETGAEMRGDRQWIVDPIDGTANFLRGVPIWGTLIALEVEGELVLGVVSAPALGMRWWATHGGGAWRQHRDERPTRLAVSEITHLEQASLSSQGMEPWMAEGRTDQLLDLSRSVWRDRAYGDLWAYMLLAEGAIDIVAEFGVHPYDLAAVSVIVREAGGRCSDVSGADTVHSGHLVATNGHLHDAVLTHLTDDASMLAHTA